MEFTRIDKENVIYFLHLCPMAVLEEADSVKFGAIDDEGYASSICSIGINDGKAKLLWIYTDPEKREQGLGTFLMKNVSYFLENIGVEGIEADFDADNVDLEFFLADQSFLIGNENSIYSVPLKDIVDGREMDGLLEKRLKDKRASNLSDKSVAVSLKRFVREKGLDPELFNGISPEYSIVNPDENGDITGGIFITEAGNDLHVNYLINESSVQGICEIICAFYDVINEKGKLDSNLIFTDRNESSISLVEHLTENDREDYAVSGYMYAIKLF